MVTVWDKTTPLVEKTDYTIAYKNNVNVGEATITVTGKGNYSGKETFSFNITPVNIESDVYADSLYVKTNAKKAQKPVPELYYMGTKLKYNKDFTVSYSNTSGIYAQEGTYSVTVTGTNNYTGTKTITLMAVSQIPKKKPISITKATVTGFEKSFSYTGKAHKQTCTLKIQTDNGERTLVEGADYTVHYTNNTKAGTHKITPKLMDLDGKLLSAGKDFDKSSITYTYEKNTNLENGTLKKAGEPVADTDIIPTDTQIRVTLNHGSGSNYTGAFTGTYRIVKADIKSAKVTIPTQIYTGRAITPDKQQIKITLNGNTLHDEDYDIVLCTDNVKKGKASITINGKGNYGGTKTVKFTIAARGFLWWWRTKE